jgi:hypothetical protein
MTFKAAFVFIGPESDPAKHRSVIKTPFAEITTVGVHDYATAETVVTALLEDGISAIELCAGFGMEGVARIAKIAKGKATVGVVRFDLHPAFEHRSGDALFQ